MQLRSMAQSACRTQRDIFGVFDKNICCNTHTPYSWICKTPPAYSHSSLLPLLLSFHLSLSISQCADVLCSADVLSLLPPTILSHTYAHTPLLLMNEWEKTLISIMHCSSFSLPLKQSLLFSPHSFPLTFSHTSARACC